MEHWRTVAWRVLIFDKLALRLRLVSAPSVFSFAKKCFCRQTCGRLGRSRIWVNVTCLLLL